MSKPNYFQSRLIQGKLNEEFYKEIIEDNIKDKLNCCTKRFDIFDFENDSYKIELKCREVERMKYPTTIIGYDKIEKGLDFIKDNKRIIFYFGFKNDGLYRFELNDDNYKDFKVSFIGCRFRTASGKLKKHVEIPIDVLEFVSDVCPIQDEYSKRVNTK